MHDAPDPIIGFVGIRGPARATIQVDLEERLSPQVVAGVRDGLASVGVCWDAVDLGSLQHRPYRKDHLCIAVPPDHPLAARKTVRFEQTLDYEHVSLPINSAVQVMLQRAAARLERPLIHRIIVSNFEAALGVVRAGLAIGVVSREVADRQGAGEGIHVIPLAESWAERRFLVCSRDAKSLPLASQLLVQHLAGKA